MVTLPAHKPGQDIEEFFRAKFPDELAPAPKGKLYPIFVHCQGSRVFVDQQTLSKRCPDQVKIALDLLAEAVKAKKIDPARAVCIAPYKANVTLIENMRKRREYEALQGMPEASTVDSFQGQENDLAVVIMGTAHPRPGPGFTSSAQRFNVMLSRQRSALIVVGDINVAQGSARYMIVDESTGDQHWTVGKALNAVYGQMKLTKRVVTVVCPGYKKVEAKDMDEGKGKGKGKDMGKGKGKGKAL